MIAARLTCLVALAAFAAAPLAARAQQSAATPAVAADGQAAAPFLFPSVGELPSAESILGALGQQIPAGAEVLPALTPTAPAPAAGPTFHLPVVEIAPDAAVDVQRSGDLVSLSVRNASLRQVVSALAETEGLNLVFASPVDVPVTAKFERAPVDLVLTALLEANGHAWARRDGVMYVTSAAAATGVVPAVQGRRVAVLELDFASAADLQPIVAGLLSNVGQSHFVQTRTDDNRRTKELLIVEDLDPYVSRVEQYVSEADQAPRQVLIDVHILQVELGDDQRTGVNWDAIARVSGARLSLRSVGLANVAASPAFFVESTGGDLGALIEALIATTDAKSLASPRILAVSGQEARIQIGQKLGYRVTLTTQTSALQSVNFLNVGVVLSVTPRVSRDGRVLMRISPEVSTGAVSEATGLPSEATTELQTDALLSSGQGMIIGGLIQEKDETNISRVPVLGSIPYVNFFFQRRATTIRRTELIVALVPHVLPYGCEEQDRNDRDLARATDPLTQGAICRYPRPYEPRMRDPATEQPRRWLGRGAAVVEPPAPADGCRRLPACDDPIGPWQDAPTPAAGSVVPAVATRPAAVGTRR